MNGTYDVNGYFWPVKPPTPEDLDTITYTIAKRVSRYLERAGYLYRYAESEYLDLMPDEADAMHGIIGAAIIYRLAFGPNQGRKALTLQTVPSGEGRMKASELVSKQAGFSLHAGVACKSHHLGDPSVRSLNVRAAFRSAGISRGLPSQNIDCHWPVTATSLLL